MSASTVICHRNYTYQPTNEIFSGEKKTTAIHKSNKTTRIGHKNSTYPRNFLFRCSVKASFRGSVDYFGSLSRTISRLCVSGNYVEVGLVPHNCCFCGRITFLCGVQQTDNCCCSWATVAFEFAFVGFTVLTKLSWCPREEAALRSLCRIAKDTWSASVRTLFGWFADPGCSLERQICAITAHAHLVLGVLVKESAWREAYKHAEGVKSS